MSELLNASEYRTSFRRQCLTTVSAIALLAFSHGIGEAADDDGNRPTVWIELGGQLSRLDSSYEPFAPEFPNSPPRPATFSSPVPLEKSPFYSIDETGKISLAPSGTAWSLSASVRYGRSSASRNMRQGTHPGPFVHYGYTGFRLVTYPIASKFADTTVHNDEQHLIVDFQVGKDVGLGLFGRSGGSSTISVGVRFAQFGSKSNVMLKSDPDWHFHFKYLGAITFAQQGFHTNQANLTAERSFHGVGPTLSWDGSSSIAGSSETGELLFDGGVNAAVLFGRQRAAINHSVVGAYAPLTVVPPSSVGTRGIAVVTYQPSPAHHARSRTIVVPNVGGFAGVTYRIENFKVSAGYRADLFFNAMDKGIDAPKSENVGFYGPFATISIGLGG